VGPQVVSVVLLYVQLTGMRSVQVLLHGLWSCQTCGAAAISKGTVAVSKGAAAIHNGSAAGSRREAKVRMKQETGSVP